MGGRSIAQTRGVCAHPAVTAGMEGRYRTGVKSVPEVGMLQLHLPLPV